MSRICIPHEEYLARVKKAAALAAEWKLDVLLVNSTESDYANARYFSGFWPLFERAGVAIAPSGDAALICGPESAKFAADVGHLDKVFPALYYRESANPAYPEFSPSTYRDIFKAIGVSGDKIRIGVCSLLDTTVVMMEGLKDCYPQAEIVDAFDIMVQLRSIKSENELACLREGFRITSLAMDEVRRLLRPGVTELQMVGIAQRVIYENGAEYEGLPMYVFSEKSTSHAISRPSYREILAGDIVQLNLSAKVDGYSPSIGYPVCVGKLTPEKREIVTFGLEAHRWTEKQLKAGVPAARIASDFYKMFCDRGHKDHFVYGPCHGIGMIEVEAPWMESTSTYDLKPNMTFQIDTFVSGSTFGIRWEKGVVITQDGFTSLCPPIGEIYELDV
ncbi:MAG: M24 family metallopeptidase [Eubacteriales bacterium]|jgi:Xaa-Pro aminopeptidase|nr:M24 family metallopeptidase [Eubacteriales bacterium]MDD4744120.1 M24 family metallopeptidase [Eubacteriales bacterium]